ncbi:Glycosyltransferase, group 2 family protein [Flavobacterium anhuiense]|uniref:Glycosyltransferase, group 2 family protein n=1 Tax=Flavobacterium anhuiense TaxID=459526 RepID=A0A444VWB3_9FLAO|nr:glycosyltransferase family 2 protein [Flavobacterium anhuiense]RYJ37834.1 Glycosyltransferase, group 2 family protein [Flavobacterium anhuiense]
MKEDNCNSLFFSIIIPVYNAERYIEDCLNSILNQSFQDFEIILVNDGSTDSSGKICDNYSLNNSCIKVIHKTNSGTAGARNSGLKIAKGEYLWFVDGDDLIEKNSLTDLQKLVETYNCIPVINFIKIDFKDDQLKNLKVGFPQIINSFVGNTKKTPDGMPSSVCLSIYNRSFLLDKDLRFEEDNFFEDEFFNLKLYTSFSFNFLNINLPLYFYRRANEESKTSLKDGKSLYEKCLSKIRLFLYVSQIKRNETNNDFLSYKKRVYAEYALQFFELCLRQNEEKYTKNIVKIIKKNILKIPTQGTYFKASQIKRLLYNLNPDIFIIYIRLLILLKKK